MIPENRKLGDVDFDKNGHQYKMVRELYAGSWHIHLYKDEQKEKLKRWVLDNGV